MTKEEAARILDPGTSRDELWKYEADTRMEACNEACRMGADALRAQQERENPKPLTLDELRQMDGEQVWDNFLMEWCVIIMDLCNGKGAVKYFDGDFNQLSERRFYRHKPEEKSE